jgi:hypothetical protein
MYMYIQLLTYKQARVLYKHHLTLHESAQGSRIRLHILRNGETMEVTLERGKETNFPPTHQNGADLSPFPANAIPAHSTVPPNSVFAQNVPGDPNFPGHFGANDYGSGNETTAARKEIEAQMAGELK